MSMHNQMMVNDPDYSNMYFAQERVNNETANI
jgi:hypothetical protein